MKRILVGAIVLAALLPAAAMAQKSDTVVKVNATADKPDAAGNQTVTITVEVDRGYHIYANPVKNDMLTSVQTKVKFLGVDEEKITYPEGKLKKNETTGDYCVYEGKVTITARVKRKKDAGPLEFTIKVQACDKDSCLFPATIKKSVP